MSHTDAWVNHGTGRTAPTKSQSGGKGGTTGEAVLDVARRYAAGGISLIPILADGSKGPDTKLLAKVTSYDSLPTEPELVRWFGGPAARGMAAACGEVSGGLELLDFDNDAEVVFAEWCALVNDTDEGLLSRVSVVRTPRGGYHVWLRSDSRPVPTGVRLAADPSRPDPKTRTLIESKGHHGYGLLPGCPPECHPTGLRYEHLGGLAIEQLRPLTADERDVLFSSARALDRAPPPAPRKPRAEPPRNGGLSPGDDFDRRADWSGVLMPHGWTVWKEQGDVTLWARPGKTKGPGASTGKVRGADGVALLHVFTTSAEGLEAGRNYGPFNALVALAYRGDHSAAARALAAKGYGTPRERTKPAGQQTAGQPRRPDIKTEAPAGERRSPPSAPQGGDAPPDAAAKEEEPCDAIGIIQAHIQSVYRPDFKRGNVLHCGDGREVKMAEAIAAPTSALIARLAAAADAPTYKGGGVNQQSLPAFFKRWAPVAWADLLASLPEEDDPTAPVSCAAADEFRQAMRNVFLTEFVLAWKFRREKVGERETKVESRSLIGWCRKFAKDGRWQSIRDKQCWAKLDVDDDGVELLRVAFRHGLLHQLRAAPRLTGTPETRFNALARKYGVASSGRGVGRVCGQRVLLLDQALVNDLIRTVPEEPEVDTDPSVSSPT